MLCQTLNSSFCEKKQVEQAIALGAIASLKERHLRHQTISKEASQDNISASYLEENVSTNLFDTT